MGDFHKFYMLSYCASFGNQSSLLLQVENEGKKLVYYYEKSFPQLENVLQELFVAWYIMIF